MTASVTISSTRGAGGHAIGQQVAKSLGLRFLDRAIPARVAVQLAVPRQEALKHDERVGRGLGELLARYSLPLAAALDKVYKAYPESAPYAALLHQTEQNTLAASKMLQAAGTSYTAMATYPAGPFGNGLQVLAEAVVENLSMRVGYITLGGFDTHKAQAGTQDKLLALMASGIQALLADLKAHGRSQDVAVMTWSEFGRRAQENGSGGTDHGTAAPLFLAGDGVKGGVYGDPPALDKLDKNGNLPFQTDFRQVYATVLERWLKVPADTVIPSSYKTLPLI